MPYQFSNKEIAETLRQVAAALEIKKGNRFRIVAFSRAADSVEKNLTEIIDLWKENRLEEIPGIGKSIAQNLGQIFKNGQAKEFETIKSRIPKAVFSFLAIPGIGAKTAYRLSSGLKIKSQNQAIRRLLAAGKQKKIRKLPGFGEKKEQEIIENIKRWHQENKKSKRMTLYEADQLAQEIINYLKKSPVILDAQPLGSLRRRTDTVGDLDLVAETKQPLKAIKHFINFPNKEKILVEGENSSSRILLTNQKQVDIRVVPHSQMGSMLQHFTGSKSHNIALRELALEKGFSLSEYGIKRIKSPKIISFSNEKDFYHFLGLDWMPPEIRENQGEIEAAQRRTLPKLVQLSNIRGDLHIHSDFPIEPAHDLGQSPAAEIISWAKQINYQYLAFSEHNPSQKGHSQKEIINLLKKKKKSIDQINYSENRQSKKRSNKLLFIFNSLEIDIKPNGELALPEEGFDFLDFAIIGIHNQFNLDKETMTKRILRGLNHPKVKILAHPSARMINKRPPIEVDWEAIFLFCQKNNKILEINASTQRLDLPDVLIKQAINRKIKLAINTDSHNLNQLSLMPYGVSQARRGWAQKENIINTLPLEKIKRILLS